MYEQFANIMKMGPMGQVITRGWGRPGACLVPCGCPGAAGLLQADERLA
jgi:hypothetical protein